jgi:CBS domain-containing protein
MRPGKVEPHAKDSEAVHPKSTPIARDIMTTRVHTVAPETGLFEVTSFLLKHDLSNAPVVRREQGKLVLLGFISEEDCLEHLANGVFYGNPTPPQSAETIMRKHPVCIGPETDIFTLASIFVSHHYRHMPVVENDCLIGIVSRRDLLRSLDRYYNEWSSMQTRDRFPVDLHEIMNHRFLATK